MNDPAASLSIVTLFLNADPVVKGVLLLLLFASVWSWAVSIDKLWRLGAASRSARGHEARAAAAQSALSRISPDVREEVLAQLNPRPAQRQPGARGEPRHEFRPAQTLPSLNSATGSNVHRTSDPDLFDNSDASVFAFATR